MDSVNAVANLHLHFSSSDDHLYWSSSCHADPNLSKRIVEFVCVCVLEEGVHAGKEGNVGVLVQVAFQGGWITPWALLVGGSFFEHNQPYHSVHFWCMIDDSDAMRATGLCLLTNVCWPILLSSL